MTDEGSRQAKPSPEHTSAIAALSKQLHVPLHDVSRVYCKQLERLSSQARIKGFLGVLAVRNTKSILRRQGPQSPSSSR